jgi:hypothetical protein
LVEKALRNVAKATARFVLIFFAKKYGSFGVNEPIAIYCWFAALHAHCVDLGDLLGDGHQLWHNTKWNSLKIHV